MLCFYIHVLEGFFFFLNENFLSNTISHSKVVQKLQLPFKPKEKIPQKHRLSSLLLILLHGCSAHRNKRQYQVSQTECVAQRVSLLLHFVVAIRGRFPGRPVLAAFILQTTTKQTKESVNKVSVNHGGSAAAPQLTCSLSWSSVSMTMEWHFHSHTILQKSSTV